jgi:signal peptidase I
MTLPNAMHCLHNQESNNHSRSSRNKIWREGLQAIGLSLIFAFGFRTFVAQGFYIASGSMQPTLGINDRFIVNKLSYRWSHPERGDIVVFAPPEALERQNVRGVLIKRVIGLPGEKVEIRGGRVYINDRLLREQYVRAEPESKWGPAVVPPNSYLVMGDNRDRSYDSRNWGFVPRDRIVGKAAWRVSSFYRLGKVEQPPVYPP